MSIYDFSVKAQDGTDEEITTFCQLHYNTTFPQFKKIDVNGPDEDPLYAYLKKQTKGFLGDKIKWNFTKFVIDRQGNVVARFAPTVKPEEIEGQIKELLAE